METGSESGMWTWARYQTWLGKRTSWHLPTATDEAPDSEPADAKPLLATSNPAAAKRETGAAPSPLGAAAAGGNTARAIEIEPIEGGMGEVLRKLAP